ncbi:MAG: 3-(3-hydroxy-phenyl)propionate transporter MhpT [Hyphomonadaceae bacterium]|nr:3-(3-hydroxy-phenyl)propionate transporter MhpT [Hyphomonadaceae bacterium]
MMQRGWVTVALCFLVATFEGVDLQAAGLVAPKIAPLFRLAPDQLGWFFSASTIGLVAGALIGGRLADRIGRKLTLMIAMGVFGVFSITTALSTGYEMLVATRLLTGLGLGGALPNLIALTSESVTANRRSLAVALMYAGMPFGGGLASLLMALAGGANDWKDLFYIGGAAPLVAIPFLMFAIPESPKFAAQGGTVKAQLFDVLFGEGRALKTIGLWISFFCALLVLYLLLNWLPTMLVSRGMPRPQASLVQAALNLVGVLGPVAVGVLMDGTARRWAVAGIFAALAVGLGIQAIAPAEFGIALVTGAVLGIGILGAQSVLYALAPSLYPTAVRGTGVGAAVAAGRLGSIVGPLLAGAMVGKGQSASQVLTALLPLVLVSGVLAFLLADRKHAIQEN